MTRARGFTLIETMAAMAILGIVIVGTMGALMASTQALRDGQTRQYRGELVDASLQRWMLTNKMLNAGALFTTSSPLTKAVAISVACPSACNTQAIGAWIPDPTQLTLGSANPDLSVGAYFIVKTDGELQQLTSGTVPNNTKCGDPALPAGSYCREILITSSSNPGPVVTASSLWAGTWPPAAWPPSPQPALSSTAYTVWVRVSKAGDSVGQASFSTTTFIQ